MPEFNFRTQRLLLRNYRAEDLERVHIYGAVPEFSRFESWGPNSIDDTKIFISDMVSQSVQEGRYKFDLAICTKENGLLIGGCGLRRESQGSSVASLGWAINPEFQGRGYATESAQALIKFGFERLQLRVIYATCDTRNSASIKVMEKLGMARVGHLIRDKMQKRHWRDSFRYELNKG
jgi:RimJ/RimL family protein N-acetyltransferase